jgi:hypothetical protein
MIHYQLCCAGGHGFDGWFSSSAAFDRQVEAGEIICPVCGSVDISKALMTPSIGASGGRDREKLSAVVSEVNARIRKFRRHVEDTAENVGKDFAEEARRMHYDETEKRGIYGEASLRETAELREEGIEVFPLPPLPEEQN